MSLLLLILGLVLFVLLVIVHEFGHYLAAIRNGVEVEEFGLGFPPRAKKLGVRKGTLFSLNWLPIGGFVKLKGEHDDDDLPGSFGAAGIWAKTKIMLAGVAMNLVAAFVIFTVVAAVGMPQLIDNQFTVASDTKVVKQDVLVAEVESGSPADKAGLKPQDKLARIDRDCESSASCNASEESQVTSAEKLPELTESLAGQPVVVSYIRDGKTYSAATSLRTAQEVKASKGTDAPKGYLGIVPTEYITQRSTWSSPVVAIGTIKQFTVLTLKGIGSALAGLFTGDTAKATEQVGGPVAIVVLLKAGSSLGLPFILMIVGVISLTLAIMNVLPIPALDGGRLTVMLIFRAFKKRLTAKTEELINGAGFATLMLLFVLITIVDVRRFF